MHCGNFTTIKDAEKHRDKCIKKIGKLIAKVYVRKRLTSIDRDKEPYEVVLEYFGNKS